MIVIFKNHTPLEYMQFNQQSTRSFGTKITNQKSIFGICEKTDKYEKFIKAPYLAEISIKRFSLRFEDDRCDSVVTLIGKRKVGVANPHLMGQFCRSTSKLQIGFTIVIILDGEVLERDTVSDPCS